jgi:hypothetical protein
LNCVHERSGLTNQQLIDKGRAPIGPDGKPVNIHHIGQTNNGSVLEISATEHQQNYKVLHSNTGQSASQI